MKTKKLWFPALCLQLTSFLCVEAFIAGCATDQAAYRQGSETQRADAGVDNGFGEKRAAIKHPVPQLSQCAYGAIAESACGPTSLAMVLQYYFPNSKVDVLEIYEGAGLQAYTYLGPAIGYENLSWGKANSKCTSVAQNSSLLAQFASFGSCKSSNCYSGNLGFSAIKRYLSQQWNTDAIAIDNAADLYAALQLGPVIGHVWAGGVCGDAGLGHYLVIVGVDDKGTLQKEDDMLLVNDPYATGWSFSSATGAISYSEFFIKGSAGACKWFRDAIKLLPNDSLTQREFTVVVDSGNYANSGNAAFHKFEVDDLSDKTVSGEFTWFAAYNPLGHWVYPKEAGHWAKFTPKFAQSEPALYDVMVSTVGTPEDGKVTYQTYDGTGKQVASTVVDQYRTTPTQVSAVIAQSVVLGPGGATPQSQRQRPAQTIPGSLATLGQPTSFSGRPFFAA